MTRRIIYIFAILLLLSFFKNEVYGKNKKKIVLNIIGFADDQPDTMYKQMINEFNEYAEKQNLNIFIQMRVTEKTETFEAYGTMVEQLLKKKNNNYDLYYFDNAQTQKYGKYLLDLRKYLPKDHIEVYDQDILEMTCEYNKALVGLPFTIIYSLLYSNNVLLKKYNKSIPQTWDELIETSRYIKEKEKDINPNLIAYNGFMGDGELGLVSIYEFIHSCRNSPEDPFPEINSKTTINALKLLKRLKNEISSDDIFKQGFFYNMELFTKNALFIKFYTLTYQMLNTVPYTPSLLPGIKKGVSGSTISGYNLGIDGNISPDKLDAALTAFKFLTTKDFLRKYFLQENIVTAIPSLYEDEEICAKVNCTIYKSIQRNKRPVSVYYSFMDYSNKVFNYISKFLYGDSKVEDILVKVEDLTKFHYVSIYSDEAKSLAYIYFAIIVLLAIVLVIILPLIFIKKFKLFFTYYYKDLWVIITLGMLVILASSIPTFGPLTVIKCNMYIVLVIFGYSFITVPILFKYIIDFPKENKISKWVYDHKYIFYLIFLLIDLLLIFIISINKLYVNNIMVNEGKNYEVCRYNSTFGLILSFVLFTLMITGLLILSYAEWCRKTYCYDVRNNSFSLYASALAILLLLLFYFIPIKNYIVYFVLKNTLNIVAVISCTISLYVLRFFAFRKRDIIDDFNIAGSKVNSNHSRSDEYISNNRNSRFVMKLREYHNMSKNVDSCIYDGSNKTYYKSNNGSNNKSSHSSNYYDGSNRSNHNSNYYDGSNRSNHSSNYYNGSNRSSNHSSKYYDALKRSNSSSNNYNEPKVSHFGSYNYNEPRVSQFSSNNYNDLRVSQFSSNNYNDPRVSQFSSNNYNDPRVSQFSSNNYNDPRVSQFSSNNYDGLGRSHYGSRRSHSKKSYYSSLVSNDGINQ